MAGANLMAKEARTKCDCVVPETLTQMFRILSLKRHQTAEFTPKLSIFLRRPLDLAVAPRVALIRTLIIRELNAYITYITLKMQIAEKSVGIFRGVGKL